MEKVYNNLIIINLYKSQFYVPKSKKSEKVKAVLLFEF